MPPSDRRSLLDLTLAPGIEARTLSDEAHRVAVAALAAANNIEAPLAALRGKSVLLVSEAQLPTVLAAIALDGIASRLLLCLPDIAASELPTIVAEAGVDVVVTNGLKEGELVIVEGIQKVHPGQIVAATVAPGN